MTTQLNVAMSEIFRALNRSLRPGAVSCIRANDSTSPNSFDKRLVKAQIRLLLLPDIIARKAGAGAEFVVGYDMLEFCDRFVSRMQEKVEQRIEQCARSNGWKEKDYVIGNSGQVWLTYATRKTWTSEAFIPSMTLPSMPF